MVPVLIGAALLIGGAYVVSNWDNIVEKLKALFKDLKNRLRNWIINNGIDIVLNKMHLPKPLIKILKPVLNKVVNIICKVFFKDEMKDVWIVRETTIEVPEEEVPERIRCEVQRENQEYDITSKMEREMGMSLTI